MILLPGQLFQWKESLPRVEVEFLVFICGHCSSSWHQRWGKLVNNYLQQDLLREFVTWDLGYLPKSHGSKWFLHVFFNSFILLFLFPPLWPSTNKISLPYFDYWILANLADIWQLRCRNINPHSTIASIPAFLHGNQLFTCLFTAKKKKSKLNISGSAVSCQQSCMILSDPDKFFLMEVAAALTWQRAAGKTSPAPALFSGVETNPTIQVLK